MILASLADMVHQQGDDERALAHMRQAIAYFQQVHDQQALLECVEVATRLQPFCRDRDHCARLLSAAAAQRESLGVPRESPNQAAYDTFLSALQAGLDPAAFGAAWRAGQTMTLDESVAVILADLASVAELPSDPGHAMSPAVLTGPQSRV